MSSDPKKNDDAPPVAEGDSLTEKLTMAAKALQVVAKPLMAGLTFVVPRVITTTGFLYQQYMKLPQNAIQFGQGAAYCFFGGVFPTLFAALQAAEHGGREKVIYSIRDLAEEAQVIVEESVKDDQKDEDGDGVKDVNQMTSSQYFHHKTMLVLRKMNPEKIDAAISSMYTVWLSVAAVLSIQFARTIALSLTIADFLKMPIDRFLTPTIQLVIPDAYDKWVPVVMGWIAKSIAMSLAWYIQSVITATSSALKGGLMMAQAIYMACAHRGWTLGGLVPEKHEDSYLDEIMSYGFAGLGFWFQFQGNFDLPGWLSLILWPLEVAEWWIRWTITSKQA